MAGFLVAAVALIFGITVVAAAGMAAAAAELGFTGSVVVVAVLTGLLGRRVRRRRRERAERARRRAERLAPYLPWISAPVTARSPLPRAWKGERDVAARACLDYAATVAAMAPGPVRDRLADQQDALEEAAVRVDALTRRAAELDRQLRNLPRAARGSPQALDLRRTIEQVRAALRRRSADMALVAARSAQVSMSVSMVAADDVAASVAELHSTVGGLSVAVGEMRAAEQRTAS